MATYAIGDIQGCYYTLMHLLNHLNINPDHDTLLLTGDLINRGQHSLKTLEFIYNNRSWIKPVLGNHDLHFLGIAYGFRTEKPGDTLRNLLDSPLKETWCNYLVNLPLIFDHENISLVHAGLAPDWTLEDAHALAQEAMTLFKTEMGADLFKSPNTHTPWYTLSARERCAKTISTLTRMRICNDAGHIKFDFTDKPTHMPIGYYPWFAHPQRRTQHQHIIFGHWAALGVMLKPYCSALDSGCIWGNGLTALRLHDWRLLSISTDSRDIVHQG